MNLQWIHYDHDNKTKYDLALVLGTRGNKICYLKANDIPAEVIAIIRSRMDEFIRMDVSEAISVLRKMMPNFSRIYREVFVDRIEIAGTFEIPTK